MSRSKAGCRGSAIIECALGVVVVVPLLVFGLQYTAAFTQILMLESVLQPAAREASRLDLPGLGPVAEAEFKRAAQNLVLYGAKEEQPAPRMAGLKREHVVVEIERRGVVPHNVTISIQGYVIPLPHKDHVLNGAVKASYPFSGRVSSSAILSR
jgi:hypothetical protein